MTVRQIGTPEFEVLEPREMEYFSGRLPWPQKGTDDRHQLAAQGDDQSALAGYRQLQEGAGSFPHPEPAYSDLCWFLGSRFVRCFAGIRTS